MAPSVDAPQIVVLEDDAELRDEVLVPGLSDFGFAVTGVSTASALYEALREDQPDIVVLNLHLPDADGFSVGQAVRTLLPHIGIVMLTGYGELADQLRGLRQGADAYLVKPVQLELLAANIRSLARRLHGRALSASTTRWRFDVYDWCVVSPAGRTVILSKTEERLVRRMASTLGQLVPREDLIAAVTDDVHDYDPHRIDSLIHRLRRKVADACREPLPLDAVHGKGYVLYDRPRNAAP